MLYRFFATRRIASFEHLRSSIESTSGSDLERQITVFGQATDCLRAVPTASFRHGVSDRARSSTVSS
jgi:hypothetical protein